MKATTTKKKLLGLSLGMWVGMLVMSSPIAAVMWFKWNSDGPGSDGGGRKVEATMAAPMQPPASRHEQRRGARATISGTVRDADGASIAGATVCAVASSTLLSADDTRRPRCTDSGPDGRYLLTDLFGVRQRVSAGAAGHLPGDHVHMKAGLQRRAIDMRPGGEAKEIDVTLVRGGVEIRGVVQDLRGAPIAGAWVASGGPERDTGIGWGRSGADGHYVLWVRPGPVTVAVQAIGHVPGSATGPSEGHLFSVYLAPESVLRGKVLRADNREPIDGARVRARPGGEAVLTDAAGNFVIDELPPGIYKPQAETDRGFGMVGEQVALGLGQRSWPLVLALAPATFVEGRIVYDDGEVCDDGALTLRETRSGRQARDTTEPGGMVHVRGLLPGTYQVEVKCRGASASEHKAPVVVGTSEVRELVWKVARVQVLTDASLDASGGRVVDAKPGVAPRRAARVRPLGAISGVLRDEDGQPVVGALVEARPEGGASDTGLPELWRAGGERPQLTDGAGRFTLPDLDAAIYTVAARRIGGGEARREGVKQGEALALALVPSGRVTGVVALYGGGTPDSFVIDLIETQTGQRRSDEFIGTAGAWGFGGLPHGRYRVRVDAREGTHEEALEFLSGMQRSGVRIELVGATTLRGTVVDLDGAPVAGLEVRSRSVRGGGVDTRYITDARGRFELARMPVGLVPVKIEPLSGRRSPFGAVRFSVEVLPNQPMIELPPIRVARRRIAVGEARGDLGFTIVRGDAGGDPLLADPLGAELRVETVRHGGPAATAGLRANDQIVTVDGQDVRGTNRSLYATMIEVPAGRTVRLGLARGVSVDVVASQRR